MRVTVCELRDHPTDLAADWQELAAHAALSASALVLLPEMPFAPWFARSRLFDARVWEQAVRAHDAWIARLGELAPAAVAGSRPRDVEAPSQRRVNEAFLCPAPGGYRAAHEKYYLPDDEGFWEASWYQRGDGAFNLADAGVARAGFLVCTEQWFFERARAYGRMGAQIILVPRCTADYSLDKWLAGARACAIVAGAYVLSSNRAGSGFGGAGWIIDPDGAVLATTSRREPWVTREIDLAAADAAKATYPRYVRD